MKQENTHIFEKKKYSYEHYVLQKNDEDILSQKASWDHKKFIIVANKTEILIEV